MSNQDYPQCPLCESNRKMKRPKPLYGALVCSTCHTSFANRRHGAYILDAIIFTAICSSVWIPLAVLASVLPEMAFLAIFVVICALMLVLFLAKDGFGGHSPGRAMMGLQVLDRRTREPIGFGHSLGRNVILVIPLMPLIIAIMLMDGYRPGDGLANTKVIWKRYARNAIFVGHAACEQCSYDLTGSRTPACPECGTAISLANRARLGPPLATPGLAEVTKAA